MAHPGKKIKELREARDWSEGELARRSGVKQPTIHRIESGESKDPRRSNLESLARVFGLEIDDLYEDALAAESFPESELANFRLLSPEEQDALLVIMRSMVRAKAT